MNQAYNALKFMYGELYHRPYVIENLPRPQKERKLPDVLSEMELMRILRGVKNLKHKTMLMLTYASVTHSVPFAATACFPRPVRRHATEVMKYINR